MMECTFCTFVAVSLHQVDTKEDANTHNSLPLNMILFLHVQQSKRSNLPDARFPLLWPFAHGS